MTSMRLIGRCAISAVVTSSLVLGLAPAVVLPVATAATTCAADFRGQENVTSASCNVLRGTKPLGDGKITVTPAQVAPGGIITISGTGFGQRDNIKGAYMAIKLEDQDVAFDGNTDGTTKLELDPAGFYYLRGKDLPNKEGKFSVTVHVPATMKPGWTWVRVLGGADGNEKDAVYKWFQITDAPALPSVAVQKAAVDRRGDVVKFATTVSNFDPNKAVTATVNGTAIKWETGRGQTADSITTDDKGTVTGTLVAPPMSIPAGPDVTVQVTDGTHTKSTTVQVVPRVQILNPAIPRATSALAVGQTGDLDVRGIPAGGTVTFIGAKDVNFLTGDVTSAEVDAAGRGGTTYKTWSAAQKGITIPKNDSLVNSEIDIHWTVNGKTYSANTGLYVAPSVPVQNTDEFEIRHADLPKGLYQTAYSATHKELFVTNTNFDANTSQLMVVDPTTLKVVKSIDLPRPGKGDKTTQDRGVFGIAVDDTRDRVWVTNTTGDSVAVYNASTLELIKQFPAGVVSHPRAVVVDEATGIAYVSEPTSGKEELARFTADKQLSPLATPGFAGAMNLRIDQSTGIISTASMTQKFALRVNVHENPPTQKVFNLQPKMVSSASAADYDYNQNVLFVSAQDTDNVSAVGTDRIGDFKWTTPVGARVLDVLYDKQANRVYTANRDAGTVSVLNPTTGAIEANIAVGAFPNHLSTDGHGTVFVVNKSSQATGANVDQIYAITPKIFLQEDPGEGGQSQQPGDQAPQPSPAPTPHPETGSSAGAAGPLLALLGGIAAVIGGFWWAFIHGGIPTHLLPPQLASIFRR